MLSVFSLKAKQALLLSLNPFSSVCDTWQDEKMLSQKIFDYRLRENATRRAGFCAGFSPTVQGGFSRGAIFSSGKGELVHLRWDWTLGVELALKHNEQDQMKRSIAP